MAESSSHAPERYSTGDVEISPAGASVRAIVGCVLVAVLVPLSLVAGNAYRTQDWPPGLSPLSVAAILAPERLFIRLITCGVQLSATE
jgi:hypothetical protein